MDSFLTSIHTRLQTEPDAQVILVTGNESADLDSIVSALTTSFFLSRLAINKQIIVLPFINIPKIDLALRSDVEYALSSNHIDSNQIFFRDHLPVLEQLARKNQLSLFLVDHNKVADSMSSLLSSAQDNGSDAVVKIVGVIDHHVDENLYIDTADPRRIEVVGSCTSLVTDQFFKQAVDSEDQDNNSWIQQVSRLLLGPILIDTKNLNPEMKKVQPLDIAMTKLIFPYTGWASMDDLYNKLSEAREDTSKLSCYDLLRKDYKEWTVTQNGTGQTIKVGISSVSGLMEKYLERDGKEVLQDAIDLWSENQALDLLLVMLSGDMGKGYQRQLIVNPISSSSKAFPGQIERVPELQLERTELVDTDAFLKRGGRAYFQLNTEFSRKQVWPVVEKLLTQPSSSSQTSNL
ncbi:Exopolyphosphatase [Dissophora globulifera]|nr:Exopolyphosphatase [Dissophora globulifera]